MKLIGIILAAGVALATGACTQDNYGGAKPPKEKPALRGNRAAVFRN
jgi:hypothetical protein